MKNINFKFILFVIITFLIPFGCNNNLPYNSIKEELNIKSYGFIKEPDSIGVYVDASMSMQGFVINTDFQFLIKNILTSFNDPAKIDLYLFDTALVKISGYRELFDHNNYKGSKANLDLLFDAIFKEFIKSEEKIFVVLTDFQFNNQNIYVSSVASINNLLNNGAVIKIFQADFDFNGLIFPQFIATKPYNFNGKRPIYILIFGKSHHLNFISDFVTNTFNYQNKITLSKDIFVIPILDKRFSAGNVSLANQKENHFYVNREKFNFCVQLKIPDLYEIDSFTVANFDIKALKLKRKSELYQKNPEIRIDSIQIYKNDNRLLLYFSNIEPLSDRVSIFKIGFLPIELPKWIHNYSILPKNDQSTKTVYLKEFFEDVFRPVKYKNCLFTSYFILEKK